MSSLFAPARVFLLHWQTLFLQFDALRQDLREDGAEAGSERAVEDRAEHHREDNSPASSKWPKCELYA